MVITSEQYLIASLTIVICIFGFIFNGMALILLFRLRELKNAFGYMCTSHILSNIGVLLCFAFWGVPMTITKSTLASGNLGKAISGFAVLFWEVSIYSHVFVALNRFVAIYMPIQYMSVFGKRTAYLFIALSWIIAVTYVLPFFVDGCGMHFATDSYLWQFDDTPCSQWISKWLDFYSSIFWLFVIAVIDLLNIIRIVGVWRGLNTVTVTGQRKRRETLFFAQAFCQNILFATTTVCFCTAGYWVADTIPTYLLTTFLWGSAHAIDGLVLIVFNVGMHRKNVVASLNSLFKNETHHHHSSEVTPQPHGHVDSVAARVNIYIENNVKS